MFPIISKPFNNNYPITFEFGRIDKWYLKIAGYPHNGVDYGMPVGVHILSCYDGFVKYADNVPDANGLGINIEHSFGMSQYWHLSDLVARQGQMVKKGEVIGYSGASGWVTGPHLHFGLKVNGNEVPGMRGWVNPVKYYGEVEPNLPTPPLVIKRHLVLPGESLYSISVKYYGNGNYWTRIYNANSDKIKDPRLIYPLQLLIIP